LKLSAAIFASYLSATCQSGFDRLRYGPARDQVLGMHVLLADGSVAKSGGRLVKNVTGYDLHRLWIGSHGRLCVILDASLRLHPLPELQGYALVGAPDAETAFERARVALESPLRPWAVCAHDRNEAHEWRALALLAGRAGVVRQEAEELRRLWPGAEIAVGDEADLVRRRARDLERADGTFPPLVLSARRSELLPLVRRVAHAAREAGLIASFWCHPGIASASVWLAGERAGDADALRSLERSLAGTPGRRRWLVDAPEQNANPREPGAALARRLERALDPDGRFVRGEPHG
jgi:glycolate oxidase FAD binding subunit